MSFGDHTDGARTPGESSSPGPPFQDACQPIAQAISAIDPQAGMRLRPADTRHLAACPSCRSSVAGADPTALFAMLALERTQESSWTGFETRTLARIREVREFGARGQPRWAWLQGRFWPLVAGSALVGAAAVLLVTLELRDDTGSSIGASTISARGPDLVADVPIAGGTGESPALERRIAGTVPGAPGSLGSPGPMLPLPQESAADPSPVESVSSATARVISIRVDASEPVRSRLAPTHGTPAPSEESDVVMIVDQGIDI